MNTAVTEHIAQAAEKQRAILEALRKLVHASVPGVSEEIKWGRPVFAAPKDFAYLKSAKAYVTLGFFKAGMLHDPDGRLEGTGKDMRHIKLKSLADVDEQLLKAWFRSAAK